MSSLQKENKIDWVSSLFICGYHLALIAFVPLYFMNHTPSFGLMSAAFFMFVISGLGITAGYHRLYSHTAYKVNPIVEAILLGFGTVAFEGSALKWSSDHRNHHAHVDTDRDPYSIKKGFMHAHILWIFKGDGSIDKSAVADLLRNKLVMFQHKYYGILGAATNILPALLFGYLCNDYFGAFLITLGLRMFVMHHCTWFINSLAHTFGSQDFSREHSAVDNFVIAFFTFGEGYHNYHHTFANDYRNGIKWYHFDPSKWLVWTLEKCGLASGLRRATPAQIQKRMVIEGKANILHRFSELAIENKNKFSNAVERYSTDLLEKIGELNEMRKQYQLNKSHKSVSKLEIHKLKIKLKEEVKAFNQQWMSWKKLRNGILSMSTISSEKELEKRVQEQLAAYI